MSRDFMPKYFTIGNALESLVKDHAEWSQATFGTDAIRGPLGPLRHLEKETREAQENPTDLTEYADCLLLLLDASRRAGFDILTVIHAAQTKMVVNKQRQWPRPKNDQPVEHVR